jgi:hypothetical protein
MVPMIRRTLVALTLCAAALSAGCGPSPDAKVPQGFARVEAGDEFAFRTANSDGVVVGVRAVDNDPEGDLAFWSSALAKRLERRGYAEEGTARAVKSKDGQDGLLHTFKTDSGGRTHLYWLGVYVTEDDVFVVEAAGDEEVVDAPTRAKIEATIASVDLDA